MALIVLAAAVLPLGWLKDHVEQALADRIGGPVTIGSIEREDVVSLVPTIRLTDLRIEQLPWAGEGHLASVRRLRARVNMFALLAGRAEPRLLSASGVDLNLARGADGRINWQAFDETGDGQGVSFASLAEIDGILRYRDLLQRRSFRVSIRMDAKGGLTARGTGEVDGNPVGLAASGAPVKDGSWPFQAAITGEAIDLLFKGSMASRLQPDRMAFRVTARADDLKLVDRVIEVGLFGTQAVRFSADVRRDGARWTVAGLRGTVGSSDFAGLAKVLQKGKFTEIEGAVHSRRLDFEDLASHAGNAAAMALERAQGVKLVPNTDVNIGDLALDKGHLSIRVDRIVSRRRPSSIVSASGVVTIDGKLLTVSPLRLGLRKGAIEGEMQVDQRENRKKPLVTLALDMRGSSIGALVDGGDGKIDAPAEARIRLAGVGDTIREAVGQADGTIGLVARDGALPAKLASLLGFDIGRTWFTGEGDRAVLRCAVIQLEMKRGTGTASPLIIDTSRSQTRGKGTIRFPDERLALQLAGAPKRGAVLRVDGSIVVAGTIRAPEVLLPRDVKSVGNILEGIGRAITDRQGPEASDADCAALSRQAIGR